MIELHLGRQRWKNDSDEPRLIVMLVKYESESKFPIAPLAMQYARASACLE